MRRIAFKMILNPGCQQEYKKRHDQLWPELARLLKRQGIEDYAIFLEPGTGELFGYLKMAGSQKLEQLAQEPLMQQWWSFMKDIMQTNADDSPLTTALEEVFYLP
jgi:L-rhamnose mutarotase